MPNFLAESYLARSRVHELAATSERARAALDALARNGIAVRYLHSTFVPEDELCLHVLEAPSLTIAKDALRRAEITFERLVEAVEGGSR